MIPRSQWGFPPFLELLQSHATLLKSRLLTKSNQGAELWLVNPSHADRDVHQHGIDESIPSAPKKASNSPYPPKQTDFPSPNIINDLNPRQSLLTSLSTITNFSRKAAQQVLAHPLAQPVVPHLPPAVRTFVNAQGEWERNSLQNSTANEFESARLYLARWARVVAEEGERNRRAEIAGRASLNGGYGERITQDDLSGELGVFSLLASPNSKRAVPRPTRTPQHPITVSDWDQFASEGRDELWVRREIFRRGFSDADEDGRARREGWEVLLSIIPWDIGVGKTRTATRNARREEKRVEYARLKSRWMGFTGSAKEMLKEEWHRIDVDARRTDRTLPIFAVPEAVKNSGNEEKEAGGVGGGWDGAGEEEEGGMAPLNRGSTR